MVVTIALTVFAVGQAVVAVDQAPDVVNLVLNFASLAVLLGGLWMAPKALRARTAVAQLEEKDRIISTHAQMREAMEQKATYLGEKAAELGAMLDEARKQEASWRARYEEQSQYTAAPALAAIQDILLRTEEEAKRRHAEMLLAMRALARLAPAAQPDGD